MSTAAELRLSRAGYRAALASALEQGAGFAAGKLGGSERAWLGHRLMLAEQQGDITQSSLRLRAFEARLAHVGLRHSGVFPVDPGFQRRFTAFYAERAAELDAIGLFGEAIGQSLELIDALGLPGRPMDYRDQEPDSSIPADDEHCWLPLLRGHRVLIVSPFAELLCERASRDCFEAVWAASGKRWFEPASVEPLVVPYGFDAAVRERWADSLSLFEDLAAEQAGRDFDVALIGAGGLGVPLATEARRQGRAGLSLGGHVQVVFGVAGARWRDDPAWRGRHINDAWTDVPPELRPDPGSSDENYW